MCADAVRRAFPVSAVPLVCVLFALLPWAGSGFADQDWMGSGCTIAPGQMAIDGGTVAYSRSGQGTQILLLHGLFAQKEQWHAVMCALAAQGFDAIAPDLPGFGQSTGFQVTAYDLGGQADRLRRFARGLGLKDFDLAANSMGGTIAAIYAERYPQDLRRLAFIGPPLGVVQWGSQVRRAIEDGINPFIPIDAGQFDLEMKLLFADPPAIAPDARDELVKAYVERNRHYQQVWDIVNLYDTALDKPLHVDIPVFILWGEGDGIYPVDGSSMLQERLPGSQLVKLPRAGHLPMLERPAETAARLIAFLRQTP
jgi:abhydrolase domain-containing protein 6